MLFWTSFSNPVDPHGQEKNGLSASPGRYFPFPLRFCDLSITEFRHTLCTLSYTPEIMQSFVWGRRRLCFANKREYLLFAFPFILRWEILYLDCVLRATPSVCWRSQRQITELFWGMQRRPWRSAGEAWALQMRESFWSQSQCERASAERVSAPSFFQPLWGNEIFPTSTASLIQHSQTQRQTLTRSRTQANLPPGEWASVSKPDLGLWESVSRFHVNNPELKK